MSNEDGSVKIEKYNESLGAKLLLDNFYITMIKTQSITIEQHQDLIINFKDILGSDYSMECLFKSHTKLKTPGCLIFLNEICPIAEQEWKKIDVEVTDSGIKNLYYKENEEHSLKFFSNIENNNFKCRIVWPTDPQNPSFDCLFLFSVKGKKTAVFCQITVSCDKNKKIGKIIAIKENKKKEKKLTTTFKNYKPIIQQMKNNGIEIKYILIHGGEQKEVKKIENIDDEDIKEIQIDCYSLGFLGEEAFFDDKAMLQINGVKKNEITCDCQTNDCSKCTCSKLEKECNPSCHKGNENKNCSRKRVVEDSEDSIIFGF